MLSEQIDEDRELRSLKERAEAARDADVSFKVEHLSGDLSASMAFLEAASPNTILSLISALEEARGQIEDQQRTERDAITQRDEAQIAGMLERERADGWKDRAEAAEAALKPFAVAAENIDDDESDTAHVWEHPASMSLDVRHFRAAVAVMDKLASASGNYNPAKD